VSEKYESEKELENKLISQLVSDGYERVIIHTEDELKANFRNQIEKHNAIKLSDKEFDRLLTQVGGKGIFASAKNLRQKQVIKSDKDKDLYIELFDSKDWCRNLFQVSNQITQVGRYETRYDVTILINGLPVVQIELKRRGIDFKEAFNQVQRYRKYTFLNLFHYVQFFVISNGIDTKYFANSDGDITFQNTFFWSDAENNRVSNLFDFTLYFLAKCHVAKMIARYMVIDETKKALMIMRPYQVYAVERLMDRATETNNNGFVWHTTGSGKTLTSFKLCKLVQSEHNVGKVFFLVDRRDLDNQTIEEFNRFEPESVDMTDSTVTLIKYIKDPTKRLLLTTIQKMSNACSNKEYDEILARFNDKKIVFIIDECHRSQFGEMHKAIQRKFPHAQYFGFTGTPRFQENPATDGRTTADIFEKLVHHYLIKDAIKDGNVLGFNIDYVKTINHTVDITDDEKVEAIDTDEVIMDDKRIHLVAEDVLKRWKYKTRSGNYNAIFTVKSIPMLLKYYHEFKRINIDNLKIGAIYTFAPNGEDGGGNREELDEIINDYNSMFVTNFSTNSFGNYFQDVSRKVKTNQLNLLLVVNMFLTGFDAQCLNTLFVDKRLKNHDLIQAFSRTNRIKDGTKPYGNIVCYQTTKKSVDDAIALFSQTDNADDVLMKPLDYYVDEFKNACKKLLEMFPRVDDIVLGEEKDNLKFVIIFRELIRTLIKLRTFLEFDNYDWKESFGISSQDYQDYLSKYLAISRREKVDKVSILDEVDFCIDLLRTDKITVDYIMRLLQDYVKEDNVDKKKKSLDELLKLIDQGVDKELRSKAELIINFVKSVIPTLDPNSSVEEEFDEFSAKEREKEIKEKAKELDLTQEFLEKAISDYQFGDVIPVEEIKDKLTSDTINRIKKERKLATALKTRKVVLEEISEFIKHISDKYR
jgi:type I restriction enzyme R subunit